MSKQVGNTWCANPTLSLWYNTNTTLEVLLWTISLFQRCLTKNVQVVHFFDAFLLWPLCLFDTNSEVFTEVSTCFKLIKSKPMSCCLEFKKIDKVEFFRLANLHVSVFCCCCVDMSGYIFLELHIRLFLCFKRNRVSWTSGRQTVYVCSECLVHVFLYFPFVFWTGSSSGALCLPKLKTDLST